MVNYVDPADLEGKALLLKRIGAGDFSVRLEDKPVGRIMMRQVAGNRLVWFWTVTGPYIPQHLHPSHGEADTLPAAKIAFRAKFDAWLAWAKQLGHPVAWVA